MTFKLDKILERDSYHLTNLQLCEVRLMNNSNYPWLILVPMRDNIVEITELTQQDYDLFHQEIRKVAHMLQQEFSPDKLNIATIGNIVSQLHMHIIARFKNDKLFPKTVWGHAFVHYDDDALKAMIDVLCKNLCTL